MPFWLPSRGNYLDNRLQFVHPADVARLIAHIIDRKQADPELTILNVAGRGDPLALRRCLEIARSEVKHAPGRHLCREALHLLWRLGISEIPPTALPYLLGSCAMDTARLRNFLEEHYRSVIQHTSEEALKESFGAAPLRELDLVTHAKA